MDKLEETRQHIARLINEKNLNYAQVSLSIGKNIAYIQQFIKNGSPRRLGEVERKKLAGILHVNEQELTDLPLNSPSVQDSPSVNSDILCMIIENIENWLLSHNSSLTPHDKAELIKLIYMKIHNESPDSAVSKVNDFIEIYDELKKAN